MERVAEANGREKGGEGGGGEVEGGGEEGGRGGGDGGDGETIEVGRAASKGRKKGHAGLSSPVAAYLGRMGGGRASMLYPHFSSQVPPLRPPAVATLLALGYPPGRASTHVLAHAY
uniref:Uncharacterized protein n=1 Tax=Vespula pensylvanica TaxID=30213 RepID=A0A834P5X6_VESPE|nr:hypothetical protein H0235_006096 [Vespula pensylvanica]